MTPNEMKVVNIVEGSDKISKRRVAGLLGVSTEYAGYLLECLANGGYLETVDRGIYAILPKGVDALLGQLNFLEGKLVADIVRLSMEKERIKKEINRLSSRRKGLIK